MACIPDAKERNGAVDATAHRHRDASVARHRGNRRSERVVEGVRSQTRTGNRSRVEQRPPLDLSGQVGHARPLTHCALDPLPGHGEPHPGEISVLGGVSYELTFGSHEKKRCPTPPMTLRA
jgi:hypothetical protein